MERHEGVAVEGVAVELTRGDRTRSLPELIFECVSAALAYAHCTLSDVDAVTIAAEDLIDGRSLSSMITGPAAGAYLRDEIRVSEDGLVALSLGAAQIQSGTFDRVLVAAWGRASEGDPERASAQGFDPFVVQPLHVTALTMSALRASATMRTHGTQGVERARAARQRQARAQRNPRSVAHVEPSLVPPYPLLPDELRMQCDVVAAAVLSVGAGTARITGVGHGTESFQLGDRSLTDLPSARSAVNNAMTDAGRPLADVDVIEFGARTMWDEVQMIESTGLADPGRGLATIADDNRFNPSGGTAAGDCEPATGLVRFVEAVLQLTGQAGGNQVPGRPTVGLVVAGSPLAGQTHTAVVVES